MVRVSEYCSPLEAHLAFPRNDWIDLGRLGSALAIIWIHTAESFAGKSFVPLCRFAIPYFVASLVFFALQQRTPLTVETFWSSIRKRTIRLYVPFLSWTAVYLILRFVKHWMTGGGSPIDVSPALLLNGSAHHLWFLPFALIVSIVCLLIAYSMPKTTRGIRWASGCAVIVGGLAVALNSAPVEMDAVRHPVSYFLGLAWDATPSVLFAIPLSLWIQSRSPQVPGEVFLILWVAIAGANFVIGGNAVAATASGMSLFVFCWERGSRPTPLFLAYIARFSFGIYLAHVAIIELLQVGARHVGFGITAMSDLVIAALSLFGSVLICVVSHQTRVLRLLFP